MSGVSWFSPPDPRLQEEYNKGYEDAYRDLGGKVKQLGKKYYKELLLFVKSKHNKLYTTVTFSTKPHKCNCEYCELND